MKKFLTATVFTVGFSLLSTGIATAQTLHDDIASVLANDETIQAVRDQVDAADELAKQSLSVYYPSVAATASVGREKQRKSASDDTVLSPRDANLTITQRLYDFGANYATVEVGELGKMRAQAGLAAREQAVLLAAFSAYANLARATEVVAFAEQSVENIKRQAELEDARVGTGGGFTTDVLQAKAQLAGAEARLVLAVADLKVAENRYASVFDKPAVDYASLDHIDIPASYLPTDIDAATQQALAQSPILKGADLDRLIGEATARQTGAAGLLPTLDLVGEQKWQNDYSGTEGFKSESLVKLELSYAFDFGLTARNSLKAAEASARSAGKIQAALADQVEEQVRNAWTNLEAAQANADLLENQALIASEFLELARQERTAGRRSLIDVLAGETAVINAQSDAAAARANVTIAGLTLLSSLGQLGTDIVAK